MQYSLVKCTFSTAVHIGPGYTGNALQESEYTIEADTLYSALCHEAVKSRTLPALEGSVQQRNLLISAMLPYRDDECFVPKPILWQDTANSCDSARKKKLKSLRFIPAREVRRFVTGQADNEIEQSQWSNTFGTRSVRECVALLGQEEPRPYQIGLFTFLPGCGLYTLIGWNTENDRKLVFQLLESVGLSGIGGKRSAGLGKFSCSIDNVPQELHTMLNDTDAPWQMLLSNLLAPDDRLESMLQGSWYQLVRRGGFVTSQGYAPNQVKKKTHYLLALGSCLTHREEGCVLDAGGQGNHPVWRYAKGMYLGVRL